MCPHMQKSPISVKPDGFIQPRNNIMHSAIKPTLSNLKLEQREKRVSCKLEIKTTAPCILLPNNGTDGNDDRTRRRDLGRMPP